MGLKITAWVSAAVLAALGIWWGAELRHRETTDNAYVRARVVAVAPEVSGRVVAVHVGDYQAVEPGQPLYTLDTRVTALQSAQARARLDSSELALQKYRAARGYSRVSHDRAVAELDGARAEAELARIEERRADALAAKSMASRGELDRARATLAQKNAKVRELIAALASHAAELALIDAEERRETALLEESRAAVALLDKQQADAEVRAPAAGRLGPVDVDVGEWIAAGTAGLRIFPTTGVWVEANFKETQLYAMRRGTPAAIEIDAVPGVHFRAVVAGVSPGTGAEFSLLPAENATGNFTKIVQRVPVRLCLLAEPADIERLRSGMSAVVRIDDREPAIDVPAGRCEG